MNTLSDHGTIDYKYSFILPFERLVGPGQVELTMSALKHYSIPLVVLYAVTVYGLNKFMVNRKPYNLRTPMFIWNAALAIFSIFGVIRTVPEFVYVLSHNGLKSSACTQGSFGGYVSAFWFLMFTFSKLVEFGDTIFIVLRKQRLIFLHYYHHATVLLYCWYISAETFPACRWFMCMNYSVHALMYSYYAFKAYGIRIPKPMAISITLLQIIQMIFGLLVTCYVYANVISGNMNCIAPLHMLKFGVLMYSSYLFLFVKFFIDVYFPSNKSNLNGKVRVNKLN